MKVQINGETREFNDNITLKEIMQILQIEDRVMAAAVNMQIIKKSNWTTHRPKENDKIELLEFVGGG